jgi:adenosylcobinamide-GDP ribazoletransferase
LHEDGLADTADGFGGGDSAEQKLEIMRDSRIGTYGVVALVLSLGLRAVALATVSGSFWHLLGALIAAHAVARGVLPTVMRLLPPARASGLGVGAGLPTLGGARAALLWSAGFAIIGLGLGAGIVSLAAAALATVAVAGLAWREIGGSTGDVLGAVEQAVEIMVLLVAAS